MCGKVFRINALSGVDISSVPLVLVNKAIFRHTLKFWSPTQYPLLRHKSLSPQLKAMGTCHKRPVLPPSTDSSAVDHENITTNTFSAQLRY